MKPKTYRNIYRYPQLRLETTQLNNWMIASPLNLTYPLLDRSSLFGIEVEIENLSDYPLASPFWSVTEDGSLRNFGREYISRPIRGAQVEYAVRYLFSKLSQYKYKFTPRCSVHVHCNARTMTPDQLNNMLMIYLIFEKLLFKFVGQDRDKNIHCVPLIGTSVIPYISDIVHCRVSPSAWMKYTALNLVPLLDKGTIEFRHMHGTDDIDKIMTWINMILKMKLYAYRKDVETVKQEIFDLNSNSQYRQFAINVFGEYAEKLIGGVEYKEYSSFMEEGVATVKECFGSTNFVSSLKVNDTTRFYKAFYESAKRHTNPLKQFFEAEALAPTWAQVVQSNAIPTSLPPTEQ